MVWFGLVQVWAGPQNPGILPTIFRRPYRPNDWNGRVLLETRIQDFTLLSIHKKSAACSFNGSKVTVVFVMIGFNRLKLRYFHNHAKFG